MSLDEFLEEWHSPSPYVRVQTSGSTGTPRSMLVEKSRMLASARRTCDFLGLQPGDTALLCMPLDYIAGKMMVVRALHRHLHLISAGPSGHPLALESDACGLSHPVSPSPRPLTFAAMVPLQVYNSLRVPSERERLKSIRHLLIGGGAVDDALAAQLRSFPHAVWSTYGMTETLSHIALRRLSGSLASDWYTPFPSVRLSLTPGGCLVINAPEVCPEPLVTNDIAQLSAGQPEVRFRILGRKDNVICSGGLKIQAEELERQLRPHLSEPFLITRRPDPKFGQSVVLLTKGSTVRARRVCEHILPRFHQPRAYLHVAHIPLTETGKPARHKAEELALRNG